MVYLRVRKIGIDVLPKGEPFISILIEKVTTDTEDNEVQVVGNYDHIYKKMSEVHPLPIGGIADDGAIDATELYTLLATTTFLWAQEKHGGTIQGTRLVIKQ